MRIIKMLRYPKLPSVYKYCGFHLQSLSPLIFRGISLHSRNPELLAILACCGIRDKTNVPTKFTLQVVVREIHGIFVIGIDLLFGLERV